MQLTSIKIYTNVNSFENEIEEKQACKWLATFSLVTDGSFIKACTIIGVAFVCEKNMNELVINSYDKLINGR